MTKKTHASRSDLEANVIPGMLESRAAVWNGYQVNFSKVLQAADEKLFTQLLDGSPDGMCQAPHWGYLFTGKITIKYKDREETITAGDAYYMEPGHIPTFMEAGTEFLEFSPKAEQDQTMAVIMKNMQKMMK
jgi:hypothetical protein